MKALPYQIHFSHREIISLLFFTLAGVLTAVMLHLSLFVGFSPGLIYMLSLLLFIAMAGIYNGLLEELNVIQPFLDRWLSDSASLVGNTWRTIAATLMISIVACNQTLPIILTGRSFLAHWRKYHSSEELTRVMADSTMLFPGMIPWSVLALMCSTITDVAVLSYLPYACFLWILPFITMIVSFVNEWGKRKYIKVENSC